MANERNDKLLSKKIDEEVKKYGVLKTAFTKIADSELSLSKARTAAFESISKIEESDNKYLKDVYLLFNGTMSDLEKLRKTQIDKLNNLIIPSTIYYPSKVKTFRGNLDKLDEIKKTKEKQANEIRKAQTKKDFEKANQMNSQLKQHEDQEILEGNKIETGLADFEAERATDNKYLLLHYIHSELAFHATALEKLTKLYGEIMCHDPKELLPDFIKNYNLNSLKETNLANKYGFTVGETARKLEKLRNPNQPTSNTNKGMIQIGVSPNPRPTTPNQKNSVLNKLDDDKILGGGDNISVNRGSQSPILKSSNIK